MPWQLIYTSAPRGLVPGQSGYCTVARSRDLREALIPRLEKLSYYPPVRGPLICAHRILRLRGEAFHVLTRIVDAGLDFTKRRSFIAHHLVFDPAEIADCAPPAEILNRWNGWVNRWDGEPQWIEGAPPFPTGHESSASFPNSIWVTSDANFLEDLEARGAGWDTTFTNHFQPGDHPEDFSLRAIERSSEGWEAALSLGAKPVAFANVKEIRKPLSVPPIAAAATKAEPPKAPVVTVAPKRVLPWRPLATVAVVLLFGFAFFFRNEKKPAEVGRVFPSAPPPDRSAPMPNLDAVFPDKPTWLVVLNAADEGPTGPIPEFHTLIQQIQKAELFTKDLRGYIQTNLHAVAEIALLDAKPEQQVLRFTSTNGFGADLYVPAGRATTARVRTTRNETFAMGVEDAFRMLVVKNPIVLPRALLKVEREGVSLDVGLEERVRKMFLPKATQLALRPMVFAAETKTWSDPLATLEKDLGIEPALAIDLPALRLRMKDILEGKSKQLDELKAAHAGLAAAKEKAVTEFKNQDRLAKLDAEIAKKTAALESLRGRAGVVPDNITKLKRFSLLLCQSNVTSEIIRFEAEGAAP